MPEWLLSGIFAWLLVVNWDLIKARKDKDERGDVVLLSFRYEVVFNLQALLHNQAVLEEELSLIAQRDGVLTPLRPLQNNAWDLLKLQLPLQLFSGSALQVVEQVVQRTASIQEMMRSREGFRASNRSSPDFREALKDYDKLILKSTRELFQDVQGLKCWLDEDTKRRITKLKPVIWRFRPGIGNRPPRALPY